MGLRVLVADDEEDIREIIQDRLEACGFNVVTASTGAEALRKIATERFDGVFLDVKMPEMTGIEVLEEVRKKDTRLPIIIITSSTSRDAAIGSLAKGANEFVLKPFEWEELKVKIEKVFNIIL
ncbi:MAG: response regulator [Deltaproteobacteria bacterium]|nr:response regulator [Deltaproteobacteria bacterium]MBI2366934.1 response regulator [Deltaproteobacteria bacterium]